MAAISLVTAGKMNVVESIVQMTLTFAEPVAVGQAVRIDTTTGKWTLANGTAAGEARVWGILVSIDASGVAGTAIHTGVVDGFDLSALAYDMPVYMSDTDGGIADDATSTVDIEIGRVIPATATVIGTAYDKLLQIDL